jgi:hypothetical protein
VEDDVEHPVQAVLDVPVLSDGAGECFGVEGKRAEVDAAITTDLSAALDLGFHHGDGFEARKSRFTREAAVGLQECDVVADGVVALFDAAVIAIGGVEDEQARGVGVVEGACDLGVEVYPYGEGRLAGGVSRG